MAYKDYRDDRGYITLSDNTTIPVPVDWTNDKRFTGHRAVWEDADSEGQEMAREYGLHVEKEIMYSPPECLHLLEARGKYYFWGQLTDDVFVILKPNNLKDIVSKITSPRVGPVMEMKELRPKCYATEEEMMDR